MSIKRTVISWKLFSVLFKTCGYELATKCDQWQKLLLDEQTRRHQILSYALYLLLVYGHFDKIIFLLPALLVFHRWLKKMLMVWVYSLPFLDCVIVTSWAAFVFYLSKPYLHCASLSWIYILTLQKEQVGDKPQNK